MLNVSILWLISSMSCVFCCSEMKEVSMQANHFSLSGMKRLNMRCAICLFSPDDSMACAKSIERSFF